MNVNLPLTSKLCARVLICTRRLTIFCYLRRLPSFYKRKDGHLTSNLFAYVPIPTKIRKDTKDCNLSH